MSTPGQNGGNLPAEQKNTGVAQAPPAEISYSEKFTNAVMLEFTKEGELEVTSFQKVLCRNYFHKLDSVLKTAELKRLATDPKYQTKVPFVWKNVNMNKLAKDVIAYSSIGMDPIQKNHVSLIPYLNKTTQLFDVDFQIGYIGLELKAKKYGYEVPDKVIIQVVYAKDYFKPMFADANNEFDTYEFAIADNPFDRGDIVGGFWYHKFSKTPIKNKLRFFSYAQILKRRPDKASVEFWGGEKDIWVDGKKTGKKEVVEGWTDEMVYKTLARNAFDSIAIDSEKIDERLSTALQAEARALQSGETEPAQQILSEINENANKEEFKFKDGIEDAEEIPHEEVPPTEPAKTETVPAPEKKADKKVNTPADKKDVLAEQGQAIAAKEAEQQQTPPKTNAADAGVKMEFGEDMFNQPQ